MGLLFKSNLVYTGVSCFVIPHARTLPYAPLFPRPKSRFARLTSFPLIPKNWNLCAVLAMALCHPNKPAHEPPETTHQSSTLSVAGTAWPAAEPVLQLSLGL